MTSRPRPRLPRRALAFCLLLLWPFLLPADAWSKKWRPQGKRIRHIRILRTDIFNTKLKKENKTPYRVINALHFSTKERVIKNELLMQEGEAYDPRLARESERALRRILRLRRVKVRAVPVDDDEVDLEVRVQETWTTEPILSFETVGDDIHGKIGIREKNFLGYGKQVSYIYREEMGGARRSLSYGDPNLGGTRLRLNADYAEGDNGRGRNLTLARPFFSSVTHWSVSASGQDEDRVNRVYKDGVEAFKFNERVRSVAAGGALSFGSTPSRIRRGGLGGRYLEERLTSGAAGNAAEGRRYAVAEASVHAEKVDFLSVENIKLYDREEDFNLGPSLQATPGFSGPWAAGSRRAGFLSLESFAGRRLGPSHFWLATFRGQGRYEDGAWRDTTPRLDWEYYHHYSPRQTLALHFQAEHILHPAPDSQILLGGDSGLRGYQLNQLSGNKLLLANLEHRLFLVPDLWRVLGLGSAAFFDAGNVWEPGKKIDLRNLKMNVGAGLRFHITRSSVGNVLRADVAYALKPVRGESRTVVTIASEQGF
ncbi:MAG: BamA/TamA family outer membrane protein [Elusimicrobiota bacterium]